MLWLIVPRVLYPDKPIITGSGPALFERMTGSTGTSVSTGMFIDGYYNAGTVGFFVIAILFGWSLAFYSAIGKGVVRGRGDLMYPLVAFGIYRGLRVDGAVISDLFGGFIIYAVLLAVYAFLEPGRHRLG